MFAGCGGSDGSIPVTGMVVESIAVNVVVLNVLDRFEVVDATFEVSLLLGVTVIVFEVTLLLGVTVTIFEVALLLAALDVALEE